MKNFNFLNLLLKLSAYEIPNFRNNEFGEETEEKFYLSAGLG
jgi:hypothetical protein